MKLWVLRPKRLLALLLDVRLRLALLHLDDASALLSTHDVSVV